MASKKKLLQAAAGSAGGAGLDVDDVFSTFLYDGNGATQTITNGIDLSGEGGLVWAKCRNIGYENMLTDTARGTSGGYLQSDNTSAQATGGASPALTAFNSNGFTLGKRNEINSGSGDFVSWTWRKAPKFFDVVTYSGSGNETKINHNLGSVPGMVIIKRTDSTGDWYVGHRGSGSYYASEQLILNSSAAGTTNGSFGAFFTSTQITPAGNVDLSGATYVMYLFAHNNNDGEFGPDSDQDIIKCGTYTGNGSSTGPVIDLGFEPQFVMVKNSSDTGGWQVMDSMRGILTDGGPSGNDGRLQWNTNGAEGSVGFVDLTPTGFQVTSTGSNMNTNNATYIYMAIRRGPLAAPEDATKVFALQQDDAGGTEPAFVSGFPVDAAFSRNAAGNAVNFFGSRLTGANYLRTNDTTAEVSNSDFAWDYMNGWNSEPAQGSSVISYMWKRAPGYFDVVAYTGTGTGGYATISHNLGVVPEMVWFKNRSTSTTPRGNWYVYHKDLANSGGYVYLNSTSAEATDYSGWASGTFAPSATGFTVLKNTLHYTSENYIAYFFATVAGVSKVGSYTGNGGTQTIDCGFSSGARFILIRKITAAGHWIVFDTERGIVAGNDPYLLLNNTDAESTGSDLIDPHSSGFTLASDGFNTNNNGQTHIFYAIA